jgi:hypothetical protein
MANMPTISGPAHNVTAASGCQRTKGAGDYGAHKAGTKPPKATRMKAPAIHT